MLLHHNKHLSILCVLRVALPPSDALVIALALLFRGRPRRRNSYSRGGGEQLQHEHDYLRPRTLQSGPSFSQKIFYIHWQSTNASFHHPHISEFLWNIAMSGSGTFSTSRYFDVVATYIVVISDLDL